MLLQVLRANGFRLYGGRWIWMGVLAGDLKSSGEAGHHNSYLLSQTAVHFPQIDRLSNWQVYRLWGFTLSL